GNPRREQGDRQRRLDRIRTDEAFEPLAESAIADLVVVVEKIDEGGRGKTKARLAARFAAAVFGRLALIDKARAKGAGDVTKRGALIVAVVALRFAGQPYVPGVVIIVVPLRSIIAAWRVLSGVEHVDAVGIVFEHQMDVASAASGNFTDRDAEVAEHGDFAGLHDAVHGIKAQPVETVFIEPVKRILDGEGANLRQAIIDRAAPRRLSVGEEIRRIAGKVISLWPEMIVDHIEKDHQPAQMRLVDQLLKIVWPAIGAVGRVPENAVIAPIARAGKIRQRQQFQRCYSCRNQMVEPVDHGAVGAFPREGTDMGFQQHGVVPGTPAPVRIAPAIGRVIDHLARSGHVVGLKRRRGIGHVDLVVDTEFVAGARFRTRNVGGKPAVFAAPERAGLVEQDIDAPGRGRPQAKQGALRRQLRAEMPSTHAEPENASTERGGAVASAADAKSATVCLTSAVFNSCCQRLYSGSFGSLKGIASGAALSTMKIGAAPFSDGPST